MHMTLIGKELESKDTWSFFWKPDKRFDFLPGQYLYYTLPKLNFEDNRGNVRQFTIASSPTEKDSIRLTTRIRSESGFKKTLENMPTGSQIIAEGPNGDYILDEELHGPQLMFAGGIGITPFRSFIRYHIDNGLKTPVFVIYSNSDENFVYKKELDKWQGISDFLNIYYFNSGISGHLDTGKIKKIISGWSFQISNFNFWIVGPPPFVRSLEHILEEEKVSEDKIHSEKFTGY